MSLIGALRMLEDNNVSSPDKETLNKLIQISFKNYNPVMSMGVKPTQELYKEMRKMREKYYV